MLRTDWQEHHCPTACGAYRYQYLTPGTYLAGLGLALLFALLPCEAAKLSNFLIRSRTLPVATSALALSAGLSPAPSSGCDSAATAAVVVMDRPVDGVVGAAAAEVVPL
jgi:hypothetical protein